MTDSFSSHELWARLRFQIVGSLLASPPKEGELREALERLSKCTWKHPTRVGEYTHFSLSTIERWYYIAKRSSNPIDALRRRPRKDAGTWKAFSAAVIEVLRSQYDDFPAWSYQLHRKNLAVLVEEQPSLGYLPSYPSLVRFMRAHDMRRRKRRGNTRRPGLATTRARLEKREVRSFEVEYTGALWHLDFHDSKHVSIVGRDGERVWPNLLAVLDDHSRLCCHAQFYLEETTDCLVHGFSQALLKRDLPRALLTDNGAAMLAGEFTNGLDRLSITHETTLPYCPEQNGKQEHFWAVVEDRFLAMLDRMEDLTLDDLNRLLQAWVEIDYNRHFHSEIRQSPRERYLTGKDVSRPAPAPAPIREAFRLDVRRKIRRSDLTISIEGRRYEVPAAYRHLPSIRVAYARFDLSHVHLLDPKTGKPLVRLFPLDRARNASGARRTLEPLLPETPDGPDKNTSSELPPYLRRCVEKYEETGLPPAFLHKPSPLEDEEEGPK